MTLRDGAELVLGVQVDARSSDDLTRTVASWVSRHESRYVCIANVHVVTTGWTDPAYRRVLNEADHVTPDGAPVAWALRRLGHPNQERVDGPGWMLSWCAHAAATGSSIYLYGSTDRTLDLLRSSLIERFRGLTIAGIHSPPFRPLTPQERDEAVSRINRSGAGVVFVGLGAPRQELWMSDMRGDVQAVMVGVGAAFDFHAGLVTRAPRWMQRHGLEWLHRLVSEPRRLWRRYLVGNSRFIVGFAAQLLTRRSRARH